MHPLFKLTWLLFLVHAEIGNEDIELVRNKIKKKMVHLVQSRMSKVHPFDNTDKSSPAKHEGDNFFQELACNFEPPS